MNRLAIGAVLGGLAVYLYAPELGVERRERLLSVWGEKRDSAVQAGRAASQAVESARPLARHLTKKVAGIDWAEPLDRSRPAISLPKLIGAAAIGATLVYFLDPVKGSERRHWLLFAMESGLLAAQRTVKAVKPHADRVSDHVADAAKGADSKVR